MKSWIGPRRVHIDCYDAHGFLEENYRRMMIVMSAIGSSTLLKREWIPVGLRGEDNTRMRCVFETDFEPIHVKTMMLGLQYLEASDVPRDVDVEDDTGLFRFATFDVFEAREAENEDKGRLRRMLSQTERRIELEDLEIIGDPSVFFVACRKRLVDNLNETALQNLLEIERQILEKLEAEESVKP